MNEDLRKKLREKLLECYGIDIDSAVLKYSTQHYAFIFPNEPYMIRVSIAPKKSRHEILSELLWVDDLKQFKQTICEPEMSLKKNIMEEFEIDGTMYRASMFRTARGNVQLTTEITPMFFICVGELLGIVHKASTDERKIGMNLKRTYKFLSPDLRKRIDDIAKEVFSLPKNEGFYGLCHGDFHMNNFFVEVNNIWLFDFDSCLYTHYLYDVASFTVDCIQKGYMQGEDCRSILYDHIMPYLKIGYGLNMECGEGYWDKLELFIDLRIAVTVMELQSIDDCGVLDDLNRVKEFYTYILKSENSLDAMTRLLRGDPMTEDKNISLESQSIGLDSVPNARQLGGYVCCDGRKIKQGLLLRAGSLEDLSDHDAEILSEKYGVTEIIDLRTDTERAVGADGNVSGAKNTHISILENNSSDKTLDSVLENMNTLKYDKIGRLIEYSRISGFGDIYKTLLLNKSVIEGYKKFFNILLKSEGAVLWHCSQGKDRTGIGAALIMYALGVDEETIIKDYELTNAAYRQERESITAEAEKRGCSAEEAARVGIIGAGVDKNDLIAALDSVKEKYGSVNNYITEALNISEDDIKTLREKYTDNLQ